MVHSTILGVYFVGVNYAVDADNNDKNVKDKS